MPMELGGVSIPLASLCSFIVTSTLTLGVSPILFSLLLTPRRKIIVGDKLSYLHTILASSIHAILVTIINGYILFNGELSVDPAVSTSSIATSTIQMSLGYTIADFIICLIDQHMRKDKGMILHHLAMIAGLGAGLYYRVFNFYIIFRSLSEFSTPFVNFWWVLHNLKIEGHTRYATASILMVLAFFVCRIAVIPGINYKLHMSIWSPSGRQFQWYVNVYTVINFIVFDFLNLFWFYKMLMGAYKLMIKTSHTA